MSGEPSESVELERHSAHLSSDEEDGPYTISGIAIGEGDLTRGQSGILKKWTREALEPAAQSLEGRPLVVDHENSSYGVVGEVTRVQYKPEVGVLYQAELDDDELAEKVENGRLEVSIRGFHEDVEEMQEDARTGAKLVTQLRFANLSIVPKGAAPSNTVKIGEMDGQMIASASEAPTIESGPSIQISAAECAEMLGLADEEENAERPEGAEKHGNPEKTIEQPERYPEGDDTPAEEAGEHTEEGDEEAEETASHDDADDELEQSRGAGQSEEPESILATVTFTDSNMTKTEDKLSEYDDPHVVEGDELSELRAQASKVEDLEAEFEELREGTEEADEVTSGVEELREQFQSDLAELKDRTAVLDKVSREDVESLAEADQPLVVEQAEHEELQEDVETVREHYAEQLSEYVSVGAERIAEKWSISEMKEDLAEYEAEAAESEEEEDLSPDLKGDDPEEEELEGAAAAAHGETEEELSDEAKEAQDRLREKILG